MDISTLLQKPLPTLSPELQQAIHTTGKITPTAFENRNEILSNRSLHHEAGSIRFSDGSYLVSMYCPMPNITAEMIDWWFWWHPQSKERYQAWFPGAHSNIRYPKRYAGYFEQSKQPPFQDNTQCPTEKIGGMNMPLRIDFLTPEEFGFSRSTMAESHISRIVCGHVGAFNGLVWHTEMAHIFQQTDNGLFLISRFWLGRTMKPYLRKLLINDAMAQGMAEHCAIEYRNLTAILPELYRENAVKNSL